VDLYNASFTQPNNGLVACTNASHRYIKGAGALELLKYFNPHGEAAGKRGVGEPGLGRHAKSRVTDVVQPKYGGPMYGHCVSAA